MQRVHSQEDQVLCHDHRIKDKYTVTWSAFAQVEKIEAVDQPDDTIVDALFPHGWTKLRLLQNHPDGHKQPMQACKMYN